MPRGAEYAEIFGVDLSRVEVEMWRRSRAERVDRVEPIRRTIAPVIHMDERFPTRRHIADCPLLQSFDIILLAI